MTQSLVTNVFKARDTSGIDSMKQAVNQVYPAESV